MEEKILSQLYNDAVINDRVYRSLLDDEAYKELSEKGAKLYDELMSGLNEEQKKLFDLIHENMISKSFHEEEAVFKYGVSLGIRMTSEAFVITQEAIEEE